MLTDNVSALGADFIFFIAQNILPSLLDTSEFLIKPEPVKLIFTGILETGARNNFV